MSHRFASIPKCTKIYLRTCSMPGNWECTPKVMLVLGPEDRQNDRVRGEEAKQGESCQGIWGEVSKLGHEAGGEEGGKGTERPFRADGRRHSGVKRPGWPEEEEQGAVADQHVLKKWEGETSWRIGNGRQGD